MAAYTGFLRGTLGVVSLAGVARSASAQRTELQLFAGTAVHFPVPLIIRQRGEPTLRLRARYVTRPFAESPYYAWRIARWRDGRAWALDFTHHKLYLRDAPAEVQRFEMTHGFNIVGVSRLVRRGDTRVAAGPGLVIAHPETTVRGRPGPEGGGPLGRGYHPSGATGQAGAGHGWRLGARATALAELRLTISLARVPVADGDATVPDISVHLVGGIAVAP